MFDKRYRTRKAIGMMWVFDIVHKDLEVLQWGKRDRIH